MVSLNIFKTRSFDVITMVFPCLFKNVSSESKYTATYPTPSQESRSSMRFSNSVTVRSSYFILDALMISGKPFRTPFLLPAMSEFSEPANFEGFGVEFLFKKKRRKMTQKILTTSKGVVYIYRYT